MDNNKVIKIAFVGTSSVGKTSLLWEYKKRMKNNPSVAFVHEAARDFFENNPTVKKRFAKDAQEKIQSLMLKREKKAHGSGAKIILCDRSVIDAVVYVRSTEDKEVRQTFHKAFLEFFQELKIPYELLSGTIEERMAKVDKLIGII